MNNSGKIKGEQTDVSVLSLDGSEKEKINVPPVFNELIRDDLILRAFLSEQSKLFQPKGPYKWAGLQTTARYVGRKEAYHSLKNRGHSMLPRELYPKGGIGRVRKIPSAVTGRRAHPPKPEKNLVERINKKEWKKALKSAISATANIDYVLKRHKIDGEKIKLLKFPIVFDDSFENLKKTKEVISVLKRINLSADIDRAKENRKKRTSRKGGKKTPRSILIISSSEKSPILKSSNNLSGVNVISVNGLSLLNLAPGGVPGRLTIWTKSALVSLTEVLQKF